jgi:hypothetical protein
MNQHRLRVDGVYGTVTGTFGSSDVTLVSDALTLVPAIDQRFHLDLTLYEETSPTPVFEVVRVVAHAAGSDTATVVRGVKGTQRTWTAGSRIVHSPTSDDFDRFLDPAVRRLTASGASHVLDDEFQDEVYSGWIESHTNAVAVTTIERGGVLSIHNPGGDAASHAAHAWLKEIPNLTYPFSVEVGLRGFRRYATNYQMMGPIFTNGTLSSSNCVWMMPYSSTATATAHTLSTRTGTRTNVATDSGSQTWEHPGGILHCKLTAVSLNTWGAQYSPDGVQWIRYPANDFAFTMTPTHVGFASGTWGGGTENVTTVEYFRVVQ